MCPPIAENAEADWLIPEALTLRVEGQGTTPARILQQVAYLARHLEVRYHGIPQDIEWTYDGEQLWATAKPPHYHPAAYLDSAKLAAEVIPGVIRPLTWSINRPLTCGVWGEKSLRWCWETGLRGLTLKPPPPCIIPMLTSMQSLLGDIFFFCAWGSPPESLEFLTRGAKFSRPPLMSTLKNVPGLLRLLQRELWLEEQFYQDEATTF